MSAAGEREDDWTPSSCPVTFLGASYANLCPAKVGRLVLDGNLSPSNWTADNDAKSTCSSD